MYTAIDIYTAAQLYIIHITLLSYACLYGRMVEGIVHTMHRFEHEHYLHIAHTLEGAHTACPVVA